MSVFEYAAVNYFISQPDKALVAVGRAVDRFFMFTAPAMWLLVLLLFFVYTPASIVAMVVLWLAWLAIGFRSIVVTLAWRVHALFAMVRCDMI